MPTEDHYHEQPDGHWSGARQPGTTTTATMPGPT